VRDLYIRIRAFPFWDAMIIGACIDSGVETLYSEDLPGRVVGPKLRLVNPFE
jgi:predicted nucleic acid-binding protein